MKIDASSIRALERVISEEVRVCEEYLSIVEVEKQQVVKFDSEAVTSLFVKRGELSERMASLRDKRIELVSMIAGDPTTTVTQLIETRCSGADKRRLLTLIAKLRQQVAEVKEKSKELAQIVDFSLGMVNGSISILWSATQAVTECYTALGKLNHSFQPAPKRDGSLLGKV